MHNDMMRIGDVVRERRIAKGMTQASVADCVGVSVRTIIDIEKDKRNPTYETLFSLLRALDIPADAIFHREKLSATLRQDQLINEIISCDEVEIEILYKTIHSLLRALREAKR